MKNAIVNSYKDFFEGVLFFASILLVMLCAILVFILFIASIVVPIALAINYHVAWILLYIVTIPLCTASYTIMDEMAG